MIPNYRYNVLVTFCSLKECYLTYKKRKNVAHERTTSSGGSSYPSDRPSRYGSRGGSGRLPSRLTPAHMDTPHSSPSPHSPRRTVGRPRIRRLPATPNAGGTSFRALLAAARPVPAHTADSQPAASLRRAPPTERRRDEPLIPDAARRDARLLQAQKSQIFL